MTMYTPAASVVDEPPELLAANVRTGARLCAASLAFFFVSFFFAFLYLRALNTNGLWRGWPHTHKPHPSLAFGIVILICVVAGALSARGATLLPTRTWRLAAAAAVALELAAVGLQCAQFSSLGFGPTDGAYASVFVGWTGLFTLMLFVTAYWLATVISDSRRAVATPAFQAAAVEAVSFVLIVMAGIEVAAFILLYVVA
jgi:heme/copper-type cytochrome/quinol oxidase subunit 3